MDRSVFSLFELFITAGKQPHADEELPMILLTFKSRSGLRLGVKTQGGILDVRAAFTDLGRSVEGPVPQSIQALLIGGPAALKALASLVERTLQREDAANWLLGESHLEYGPCVPQPGKILCIGLNYRQHAIESGAEVPKTPVLFSKFNNAVAACGELIPLPENAVQYDYEAELVVVIGRPARYVSEEKALESVFGYCNANDLSARDLQMRTSQWLLGKSPDKFMPIGPYLVTQDEIPDPQILDVCCWVNGDQRQNSNTADMVFPVKTLVSYLSQYMTLEPGDVILTGTPQGVVLGRAQKDWLVPGDEVTVRVGSLGNLTNRMVREE
jgi:2-keto-4-pentenoate hydratase/2-oxohepta-3-ene-1,7-dioic acid hydratase in catechol pathway